jgi:uncharacterized protein (TIGR01319 family)
MKIDVIVAEVGSTTTVVNAFHGIHNDNPTFIGQGMAKTTVDLGDVTIGLYEALADLQKNLKVDSLDVQETFATSSAAGGLKMSVHGLVYDMTAKAAKEAALGAGANVHLVTAGNLNKFDIEKIKKIKPNIIMIAGGVDYGEYQTALFNAYEIANLHLNTPIIYAGNIVNIEDVKAIFEQAEQCDYLHITDNVYPKIDVLQVEPARKIIQDVFEKHIIHAPGMEKVKSIVNQHIIPTPGAVMLSALLLEQIIGDLVVIDVGGATTDVHSVTSGSIEVNKILLNPEPFAKRTVEGDLGVFINRNNIIEMIGQKQLMKDTALSEDELSEVLSRYQAIPTGKQIQVVERLTLEAVNKSIIRHAGKYASIYATSGKTKVAEGKDLTSVNYIIGTGGALTRLPKKEEILMQMVEKQDGISLKPTKSAQVLIDHDYIMASIGVLSMNYPQAAIKLLKQSLKIGESYVSKNHH